MNEIRIDIGLIIDAVIHRWKMVVVILIALPLAAVVANQVMNRAYRASARLVIQENRSVNPFLGDMMVDLQVRNRFPVIANVLRSRTVTERMLLELGEIGEGWSVDAVDWAVEQFQDGLAIDNSGGGVIRIEMQGETPQQALSRLELAMDMLLEEMLRPQRESLTGSVEFLEAQVERVGRELSEAEDAVREFKEDHAEELPEVYEGNLNRYLATLAELGEAESDLGVAEGQLELSRAQLAAYNPGVRDAERELRAARGRVSELLEQFTDEHPDVIDARSRVRAAERELEDARQSLLEDLPEGSTSIEVTGSGQARIVAGDMVTGELLTYRQTMSEVQALRYRVDRLREQRDELQEIVRSFAANEQRLGALSRDVEAKQELYVNLRTRYEDARMTREVTLQSEASRVWIIESPTLPATNNRRPLLKVLAFSLAAALMMITGLIALLEFLEPTVRTQKEATQLADAPIIGALPRMNIGV